MKYDGSIATRVEKERRIRRIEEMLLRGITSYEEMASAFGVESSIIASEVKDIRARWRQSAGENTEELRALRVKQVEKLAQLALNSYDRSRMDSEEFTITEKICDNCSGKGLIRTEGVGNSECASCGGLGKNVVETTRIKGQPGDPAWLRVAKECIVEAARMEGSYPTPASAIRRTVQSENIDGEIRTQVDEIYYHGPVELILKAKSTLDDLRYQATIGGKEVVAEQKKKIVENKEEEES